MIYIYIIFIFRRERLSGVHACVRVCVYVFRANFIDLSELVIRVEYRIHGVHSPLAPLTTGQFISTVITLLMAAMASPSPAVCGLLIVRLVVGIIRVYDTIQRASCRTTSRRPTIMQYVADGLSIASRIDRLL